MNAANILSGFVLFFTRFHCPVDARRPKSSRRRQPRQAKRNFAPPATAVQRLCSGPGAQPLEPPSSSSSPTRDHNPPFLSPHAHSLFPTHGVPFPVAASPLQNAATLPSFLHSSSFPFSLPFARTFTPSPPLSVRLRGAVRRPPLALLCAWPSSADVDDFGPLLQCTRCALALSHRFAACFLDSLFVLLSLSLSHSLTVWAPRRLSSAALPRSVSINRANQGPAEPAT